MISATDKIKELEKERVKLEKLVELEEDMNKKQNEYLKAKEKYENQLNKLYPKEENSHE